MNFGQNIEVALELLRNAAVIALGTLGFCQLRRYLHGRARYWVKQLLYGVLFAVVGAFTMLRPVDIVDGVPLDLHVAVIPIVTAFVGIGAGVIASAILLLLRVQPLITA